MDIKIERLMYLDTEIIFAVRVPGMTMHYHIEHDWHARQRNQAGNPHCGIELHCTPSIHDHADHAWCRFLNGPCQHDGSTLAAYERWNPLFYDCNELGDFEPLWQQLENTLRREIMQRKENE